MISAKEIPPEAILLAVYLELQNGMFLISVSKYPDCHIGKTMFHPLFSELAIILFY